MPIIAWYPMMKDLREEINNIKKILKFIPIELILGDK